MKFFKNLAIELFSNFDEIWIRLEIQINIDSCGAAIVLQSILNLGII